MLALSYGGTVWGELIHRVIYRIIGNLQPNPSANLVGNRKELYIVKKFAGLMLAIVMVLSFGAGSVFASSNQSTLDIYIDDVLGTKYKYGGTSVKTGFDCSGFVNHIFSKMGYELERRSADIATEGTKVAKDELRVGDLVFFDTSGKNNGGISHVGIYVGNGQFAHASTSKGVIIDELDSSYYKPRYVTARRILSETDFQRFTTVNEAQ